MNFSLSNPVAPRLLFSLLGALLLMCGASLAQAQTTTTSDGTTATDNGSTTTSGATITLYNSTNTYGAGNLVLYGGNTILSVSDSAILTLSTATSTSTAGTLIFNDSSGQTSSNTSALGINRILFTDALNLNGVLTTSGSSLTVSNSSSDDTGLTITTVSNNAESLVKTRGGTLTFTNSAAGTGAMILNGGTVYSNPVTTTGSTLSLTSNGGQFLTSNSVYTGGITVNGATILTNGNALGTLTTDTLTLSSGGTFNLAALSASGTTLVLGDSLLAGGALTATTVSLTTTGTLQGGTSVRVNALGSIPVGKPPGSASFAAPAVALLGVGSLGDQPPVERGVIYSQTSTNNSPTIGGSGVVTVAHTGLVNSAGSFSLTAAGLSANTSYTYRVYATDITGATYLSTPTTFKTPTVLQNWRQTFFGSTQGADYAADNADPDGDGVPNLLEFATGKNPTVSQNASSTASPGVNGGSLEYTYSRSLDALNAGTTFIVEWNDTLNPAQWSSAGVSEVIVSDDGIQQQVKASVPAGSTGRRFMRLKVLPPAQ